jgi:hypothetical protein
MIRDAHFNSAQFESGQLRRLVRAGASSPVTWCALGFFAGAVFWHFVGFWDFVSQTVLEGRPGAQQTISSADHSPNPKPSPRDAIQPIVTKHASCAVLALNRVTGETIMSVCTGDAWHHRQTGLGTRQDRLPISTPEHSGTGVAGWSTRVDELGADLTIR